MPLASSSPVAFIPTRHADASRAFYEDLLGLRFESDDQFALVFRVGPDPGSMLRIVRAAAFTPQPFTIFGWECPRIDDTVQELTAKGIQFLRFSFFEQDAQGVWLAPDGTRVAWFTDPDGNTLSLSQHVEPGLNTVTERTERL